MKHIRLFSVLTALWLAAFSVSPAAAQNPKIGFINSQQILSQAPGTAEARQALEAEMARVRTEMETMGKELERMRTDYEKQQATLSASAKQQKQQEMQQKFTSYQQRATQLEQTAQRREAELVEPIMKRVSEVIEQIRKEGNYAMIFDSAAGSLITADPSMDLTNRVLERLRRPA